jgi:hypothetical protein
MINTESTRALGVKASSRTDLNTEIADRKSAITGEAKSRSDSDIALGVRINNEISRAQAAEVSNFQTLDGYIATEQARAMTKENSLQSQVNFIISNVDSKALDSLSEIVGKLNSAGTDLYARVLYLESVVGTLRVEALYATAQTVYVPGSSTKRDIRQDFARFGCRSETLVRYVFRKSSEGLQKVFRRSSGGLRRKFPLKTF